MVFVLKAVHHPQIFPATVILIQSSFHSVFNLLVAVNGEEARGGASSAHTVRNYCRKLAGKPHPEGVPEGLLPGPSGHTLPRCWTGRKTIGGSVR